MRATIALLTGLLVLGGAGLASAAAEELAPETAAMEVAKSSGVVLVDLYAHW